MVFYEEQIFIIALNAVQNKWHRIYYLWYFLSNHWPWLLNEPEHDSFSSFCSMYVYMMCIHIITWGYSCVGKYMAGVLYMQCSKGSYICLPIIKIYFWLFYMLIKSLEIFINHINIWSAMRQRKIMAFT